jgi:SAM-dependent methyltransferase
MDAFFARFFPGEEDAEYGYHRAIRARLEGRRILNFGCGRNTDLDVFRREGQEVWGVDFDTHPELEEPAFFRPLAADGRAPFPDGSFDLVAARWVLEHVAFPGRFLAEVRRLLRPGGRFVALTVHAGHYACAFSFLAGLLSHGTRQHLVRRLYGRPVHDTFPVRYRLNTPAQIGRRAAEAGLHLEALTGYANADYFRFAPVLRRTAIFADWLLEKVASGRGRVYLVATLRKPAAVDREVPGADDGAVARPARPGGGTHPTGETLAVGASCPSRT